MVRLTIISVTVGAASAAVLRELTVSSQASQLLDSLSSSMLDPRVSASMDIGSAMTAMEAHIDAASAAKMVVHKGLPQDVQSMVQEFANGNTFANGNSSADGSSDAGFAEAFSEESLAKARKALNA